MNLKITKKNLKKLKKLSQDKQKSVQKLINEAITIFLIIEKETEKASGYTIF